MVLYLHNDAGIMRMMINVILAIPIILMIVVLIRTILMTITMIIVLIWGNNSNNIYNNNHSKDKDFKIALLLHYTATITVILTVNRKGSNIYRLWKDLNKILSLLRHLLLCATNTIEKDNSDKMSVWWGLLLLLL